MCSVFGISKDISWLGETLKNLLDAYMQWTSFNVQNEILDIITEVVLANDAKRSREYSVIIEETTDISAVKQVSLSLFFRFTTESEIKEHFIGIYVTPSSTAEIVL